VLALPLALLALLSFLAGCGGTDGGGAPDSTDDSTATSSAPDPTAGCAFLALDDVSAATGEEMTEGAFGPGGCTFGAADPASELNVTLTFTPIAIDAETYAQEGRDLCEDTPIEVDAGDIAFACMTYVPLGFVFIGANSILVQVDGAPDDSTGVAFAAALLPSISL